MAVSSSIAYAGPDNPAAHRSAAAMEFVVRSGFSTCGKIEKSTTPSVLSPAGDCQVTKSAPTRGVITMLPALTPTQTVSSSDGRRSARPDARSQWHRYAASPPSTSRTSVSRTSGTQRSASRLGRAVSSSTPTDFQPSPTVGVPGSCPLMHRHAWRGPAQGCPYKAVGMQRASHSAIGLPSSSTSASWMLAFLMPADVSRSFKLPPEFVGEGENVAGTYGSVHGGEPGLFLLEPVARLTEGSLGEREDLGRLNREHEDRVGVCLVPKSALVHFVVPAAVPLRLPRPCEPFEDALIDHLDGLALDHDVEPSLPFVATGHQDHVLVGPQVHGLLLAEARREIDRVIEPDTDAWRRMRPTVPSDGRDPEQLGVFERPASLIPVGRDRGRVAEARVELSHWMRH